MKTPERTRKTSARLLAALLALVMILGMFAGCKSGGADETQAPEQTGAGDDATEPGGTTEGEPQYGGHLRVRIAVQPSGLDPLKSITTWKYYYTTLVYETILTRDAENEIAPSVCDYKVSDDWLNLTLWVREGATFTNGDPVEIEDVEASLDRSLNLYGNAKNYIAPYLVEKKIEGNELHLTFSQYSEKLWYYLASYQTYVVVMPKEICEKYAEEYIVDNVDDAIGTGPYKFTNLEMDVSVTVERREGYVPVPEGRTGYAAPKMGYLDSLTFYFNDSDSSTATALFAGEYDVVEVVPTDMYNQLEPLGLVVDRFPSVSGCHMMFNAKGKNNVCGKYKDLRKAIMAAIDYETFLDVITDHQQVMGGCLVQSAAFYTDVFEKADYYGPQNLELAAQYLAAAREAGYNDEEVQIVVNAARTDTPTLIKSYMDAAGIPCKITMLEAGALSDFQKDVNNNFDIWFGWATYPFNPASITDSYVNTYWGNEQKDALFATLTNALTGSDEYVNAWKELAELWVDECPNAFMSTMNWFWFHPNTLNINDEGLIRYFHNTWWEDPENHPMT